MKKLFSVILLIVSLSCMVFATGCGSKNDTFTITFDANGGTVSVETMTVKMGQSYELPIPEKEGFTFKTWMLSSSKIAVKGVWNIESDVKLVAVYEGNEYNVNIYDVLNKPIMNCTVAYGEPYEIVFDNSIKNIVDCLKLKDKEETFPIKGESWPFDEDVELNVVFKPITVVFNLNGGSADFPTEVLVNYGQVFDVYLYMPTKTGAVFESWTYGNMSFSILNPKVWDIAKETVELKAKWRTYTNNH